MIVLCLMTIKTSGNNKIRMLKESGKFSRILPALMSRGMCINKFMDECYCFFKSCWTACGIDWEF